MIDPSAFGSKPAEDKPKVTHRHYVVHLEGDPDSREGYYLPEDATWARRPYGPEGMAPALRGLPGLLGLLEGTQAYAEPGPIEDLSVKTHTYANAKGEEEAIIYISLLYTEERKKNLEKVLEQQGDPERPEFVRDSFEGGEFKPYSSESAQVNADKKLEVRSPAKDMQRVDKSPASLGPVDCMSTTALAAALQESKPELFYHLDICGTPLSRLTAQQMGGNKDPQAALEQAREYLSGFLDPGVEAEKELYAQGLEFLARQEAILALSASEKTLLEDKDWFDLLTDEERGQEKSVQHQTPLERAEYWRKRYEEGEFSNKAGLVQIPGYNSILQPQDESKLYTDELTDDPKQPAVEKIGKKFEEATKKDITPLEGLAALLELIINYARLARRKNLDGQVDGQLSYLQNQPEKVRELQARLSKESKLLTEDGSLNGQMLAQMTPIAAVELMYAAKMQNPDIKVSPAGGAPGQESRHQNMLDDLWKRVEVHALQDRMASEEVQRRGRQLLEQQRTGVDPASMEPLSVSAARSPAAAASSSSAAAASSPAAVSVPFSPSRPSS